MQKCLQTGTIAPLISSKLYRRDELIETVKMLYYEAAKKNLPIYGVSTRNLKDFVASLNEKSRGFHKMPTVEFRMWEADIDK